MHISCKYHVTHIKREKNNICVKIVFYAVLSQLKFVGMHAFCLPNLKKYDWQKISFLGFLLINKEVVRTPCHCKILPLWGPLSAAHGPGSVETSRVTHRHPGQNCHYTFAARGTLEKRMYRQHGNSRSLPVQKSLLPLLRFLDVDIAADLPVGKPEVYYYRIR